MDPLLLEPGEGEIIGGGRERLAVVKASTEGLALTEFRHAAGQRGPDRHIHRTHADAFWVLAGELTVELGPEHEQFVLAEGDWAMAPAGVVHTFWNDGPADVVFLNVHAPGAGFGEYMITMRDAQSDEERKAAQERFDQWDPPADGGLPLSEAHLLRRGEGETIAFGHTNLTIKAGAQHAGGPILVMEWVLEPDFPGPVVHRHRELTDSFYVLDGDLGVIVEDRKAQLPQGGYALVPPGVAHTFFNTRGEPTRVLSLMMPAPADPAATLAEAIL